MKRRTSLVVCRGNQKVVVTHHKTWRSARKCLLNLASKLGYKGKVYDEVFMRSPIEGLPGILAYITPTS